MAVYNVILVENEELIRIGIKKLLEKIIGGFKVVCEADNGEQAIRMLYELSPDILITDIRMQVMDGIEMVKQIRKYSRDLPIVVISGYDDYNYMREAIKYNVSDYLLKPINRMEFSECMNKIKKTLEQKQNVDNDCNSIQNEDNGRKVIKSIKEILFENCYHNITLQEISKRLNFNYQYLSTLFKKETGKYFSEYLIDVRVDKAKKLLADTNLRVYEIAGMCGYNNNKHFMVMFRKMTGKTPSQYREEKFM